MIGNLYLLKAKSEISGSYITILNNCVSAYKAQKVSSLESLQASVIKCLFPASSS